jgi:Zn-finger nucleic acid-binding protein
MDSRMQLPATLVCPKCQGAMRTYERSDITIDQCSECRGIFLDRGELERLLDAESAPPEPASAGFATRGDSRDAAGGYRRSHDHDDQGDSDDSHDRERGIRDRRLPGDDRRTGGRRESRFGGLLDLFGGGD